MVGDRAAGRLIGYARVSTLEQETRLQLGALEKANCYKIYSEKTSGISSRPVLQDAVKNMASGDTLVVYKFDRLGRSLRDLLQLIDTLAKRGIGIRSLTEPLDTSTPIGKLLFQQLGAFAEFERSLIRERSIAGQRAAIERGVKVGRPSLLSDDDKADVRALYAGGFWTMAALAVVYDVHPSVIKRILL